MKIGLNFVSLWFGLLMMVIVFAGVVAFTFTDFMNDRLFGTRRTVFVFILLAYGIYRGFRIYQVVKAAKEND